MAITLNGKVYSFAGITSKIASYFNRPTGQPSTAWSELTATAARGSKTTGSKSRARWKLGVPVVASASDAQFEAGEVMRVSDVDITIRAEDVATDAELADLYQRIVDLVASDEFKASVKTLVTPAA